MSRTLYPRAQKRRQQRLSLQDQKRSSITPEEQKLLDDCRGKPFWVTKHNHIDCCFNCIIGWPRKDEPDANNVEHPIYDYEIDITNDLDAHHHLWVKKSRGLGITEIILRYLAWCCLSSDYYANRFIHIIAGTREEFANKLIVRLENIFQRKYPNVRFQSKYTELWLNKTLLQIYPSKIMKDLRGHVDVSFMFIDEADYFDPKEQQELPFVIKSYEEKSNAQIIMVSTPNRPDGLFADIEQDLKFKGFFHKLQLGYQVGLDKIYNRKFIEREMQEPEFEREYNLKYLGKTGNVFSPIDIDNAIALGEQHKNIEINPNNILLAGVDPAFGSTSKAALTMVEFNKELDLVRVVLNEEWNQTTPSSIALYMHQLHAQYPNNLWFYIDGSGRSLINEAKVMFNEVIKKDDKEYKTASSKIIPINFTTEHKKLLEHCHYLIAKGRVAIPKSYSNLITSLRTAWAEEWNLNKDESVANDHLDSLRLALREIKFAE